MFGKFQAIKDFFSGKISVTHGSSEVELNKTNFGFIYCETALMERIVAKVAKKIKGIRDAKVVVDKPFGNYPLKVRFSLMIAQDCSANDLSETLVEKSKQALRDTCGIKNAVVEVRVTDVERVEQRRRVK